jgi:DNA-binding GntR family transcriptional regulator
MDVLLTEVAKRCRQTAASDIPKYRRLMSAIQDAITSGIVAPGDRIPTEKDIASALPFALGTVQKALNGLVRRSGTFVSDTARPLDDMSQFVFERSDGTLIDSVLTEITGMEVTHDTGTWSALLGACAAGYIRIMRTDRLAPDFQCYVEIYLRADSYPDLLAEKPHNLSGRNIRTLIETRYGDAVSSTQVAVAATPTDRRIAHRADFPEKGIALRIDVTGFDSTARALFTQTAYAPAGPYRVKFRADTN